MRFAARVVALLHFALLAVNVMAIITIAYKCPWYLSVPMLHWHINAMLGNRCPFTLWEDSLRRRAGMSEIKKFINHYMLTTGVGKANLGAIVFFCSLAAIARLSLTVLPEADHAHPEMMAVAATAVAAMNLMFYAGVEK